MWANNSEWLKCCLGFISKGGATYPNYQLFCKFSQFTKTKFVLSQFWWIATGGFNGMKYIIIQISVQVDPHVDYTIQFFG